MTYGHHFMAVVSPFGSRIPSDLTHAQTSVELSTDTLKKMFFQEMVLQMDIMSHLFCWTKPHRQFVQKALQFVAYLSGKYALPQLVSCQAKDAVLAMVSRMLCEQA